MKRFILLIVVVMAVVLPTQASLLPQVAAKYDFEGDITTAEFKMLCIINNLKRNPLISIKGRDDLLIIKILAVL